MAKDFTLDDFRRQFDEVEQIGMKDQNGRVPGLSAITPGEEDQGLAFRSIRLMLDAMTDEERSNPELITISSRSRIAARAGVQAEDVEELLAQFHQVRGLIRQMAGMSFWQRLKMVWGFGKLPGPEVEPNSLMVHANLNKNGDPDPRS